MQNAGSIQGRVILQSYCKKVRVVFEGVLYSRAGSVTGFTVITWSLETKEGLIGISIKISVFFFVHDFLQ